MIGATVDQYKITKALDNRITYEVFLAQHIQTGAQFQLHALSPNLTMSADFNRAIKNEVSQLIGLEHPSILAPTNILDVDGRLYIVYPHEDGHSLRQMIASNRGQFPIDGLMRIFKDILRGLGYAHSEGFNHRALSLDAILVNDEGDAKLFGFGQVLFNALEQSVSKDDMIPYARYYAPERFSNPQTEDIRANIFSLGAILYQMTTGQLPMDGDSFFRLEMAHADPEQQPPIASRLRNDLPPGYAEMLHKAMDKKPEGRFQNPIEFYKEIEKIESKKRSALFDEDFVKGFGNVENDTFSITDDDISDHSASFKIEDPFASSGFDLGSEGGLGGETGQENNLDQTLKDDTFDPKALSSFNLGSNPPEPKSNDPFAGAMDGSSPDSGFQGGADDDPFGLMGSDNSNSGDSSFGSGQDDPFQQASPGQSNPFDLGPSSEGEPFDSFGDSNQSEPDSDPFGFQLPSESNEPATQNDPFGGLPSDEGPSFDFNMDASNQMPSEPSSGGMVIEGNDAYDPGPQGFDSDDGAFHFTPSSDGTSSTGDQDFGSSIGLDMPSEPEMPLPSDGDEPPAMPSIRRVERQLETSLASANRAPMQVQSLKKKNKMIPVFAAAAVVVLAVVGFMLFQGYKKNQAFQAVTGEIKGLLDQNRFAEAKEKVQSHLSKDYSSDQKNQLEVFRGHIEKALLDIAKQVEGHFEKARLFETQGMRLIDGENDAFSEYKKITKVDPNNTQAVQEMTRIRDLETTMISQMIEEGDLVEALMKLRVLKRNYPDEALEELYRVQQNILKQSKGIQLEKEFVESFEKKDYDKLPAIREELFQIDPSSKFLKDESQRLSDALIGLGEREQERKNYEQAEHYYQIADQLTPDRQKIQDKLESVASNAEMLRIERAEERLNDAMNRGDLKEHLAAAKELSEIDPGNVVANNALIEANEKVRLRRIEADRMRSLGRFKEAAEKYKALYDITGKDDVKKLWVQHRSWSPPKGMVYIPKGRYRIGYSPDRYSRPGHYVQLSAFYVDKYEVTNGDYKRFVDANPKWSPAGIAPSLHDGNYLKHWVNGAPRPGTENLPVVYVSQFAAKAYASYMGKRLLTEAEWETAAAGGTTGQKYWWGDSSSATKAVYNKSARRQPATVGTYPANEYEIYEILGNVSEWVADMYDPSFYAESQDATDPLCKKGETHIHRGGSFRNLGREITIHFRFLEDGKTCQPFIGFRCGKDAR